jgi:hypothetical protein
LGEEVDELGCVVNPGFKSLEINVSVRLIAVDNLEALLPQFRSLGHAGRGHLVELLWLGRMGCDVRI